MPVFSGGGSFIEGSVGMMLAMLSECEPLDVESERSVARLARSGDDAARDRLIMANMRFAYAYAKRFEGRGVELADLVQEANLALVIAADQFDPERGVRFLSYAVWWMRNRIVAMVEGGRLVNVGRNALQQARAVVAMRGFLWQRLEREPTDAELASAAGVTEARLSELLVVGTEQVASLDELEVGGGLLVADARIAVDEWVERAEIAELVREAIGRIASERWREVLEQVYGVGCEAATLAVVGERYGVTRQAVSAVAQTARRALRVELEVFGGAALL